MAPFCKVDAHPGAAPPVERRRGTRQDAAPTFQSRRTPCVVYMERRGASDVRVVLLVDAGRRTAFFNSSSIPLVVPHTICYNEVNAVNMEPCPGNRQQRNGKRDSEEHAGHRAQVAD